jgi:hypothetical protein
MIVIIGGVGVGCFAGSGDRMFTGVLDKSADPLRPIGE